MNAVRGNFGQLIAGGAVLLLTQATLVRGSAPPPTPVTFAAAVHYDVGEIHYLSKGDFNGDNTPDLIFASSSEDGLDGLVSVMLGNGDGTFASSVSYPIGALPFFLTAADVNLDGHTDVAAPHTRAIFNEVSGEFEGDVAGISVLLGKGDGTFATATVNEVPTTYPDYPQGLAVGDFNGDGTPDLASAQYQSVWVWLGSGDGIFERTAAYSLDPDNLLSGASEIATGDFNEDGKVDLVTSLENDDTLKLLLGHGDGTFEVTTPAARSGIAVAVADFDADGHTDLVTTGVFLVTPGEFEREPLVLVLFGNGDGTFDESEILADWALDLAVDDFNGDGNLDVAGTIGHSLDSVAAIPGYGDGTFAAPTVHKIGREPRWIVAGDFNGDGRPDVAAENEFDDTISVLLNTTGDPLVIYNFTGLFPPTAAPPAVNVVQAGSTVPIVFSLDGNQGLDIFAAGSPTVSIGSCAGGATTNVATQSLGLLYDAATDRYTFKWKTLKSWAGQCGTLHLTLADGQDYTSLFKFKK